MVTVIRSIRAQRVATFLSPLRGLRGSLYPGLAPWAAFFRRFAADAVTIFPFVSSYELSKWTHEALGFRNSLVAVDARLSRGRA